MTAANIVQTSPKHLANTAPSRGLSPGRSPLATTTNRMPSPRTPPAIRPQSPLSPRYESPARFEPLRPQQSRNMNSRSGNSQRRADTHTLKLPTLPKYHPANFPPAHSIAVASPESNNSTPPQQISPRQHQRVISDAQRQLFFYQREMMNAAVRSSTPPLLDNPVSPRLAPMGSPGPVTPLELESKDGYLAVGMQSSRQDAVPFDELAERLMKEQANRQRRTSNSPSLTSGR